MRVLEDLGITPEDLKRLRREDETRLSDLLNTRDNITKLAEAKIRLNHLYDQVLKSLQDGTPEIIKLALDALDIKVYASNERVGIQGVIPLALPTTEQTSASPRAGSCPTPPAG